MEVVREQRQFAPPWPILDEVSLINFLEWLDGNEVKPDGWVNPDETHEDTARKFIALER